jgi:hypothetical protein
MAFLTLTHTVSRYFQHRRGGRSRPPISGDILPDAVFGASAKEVERLKDDTLLRMPPLPRDRRLQRESTSGVLRHEEIRPFVQKHFGDRMVSALKLDFYQISNPSLAKFAYAFSYSLLSMLTRCRYVRPLLLLVPKESNSTRVSFVTSEDAFESSALANMKVECRWDAPSAI